MTIEHVEHVYETAKERLLFTLNIDFDRSLDITTRPIDPSRGTIPGEVAQALVSVILNVPDISDETLDWALGDYKEVSEKVRNSLPPRGINTLLELQINKSTAYICPIISDSGEGYQRGFVVATNAGDALTVAEYMSGGRVEIRLDLRDFDGELLDGDLLGDLGYADVTGDTDAYRRVIEGERFAEVAADHLDGDVPEPQYDEYPGAEILATFTKMP